MAPRIYCDFDGTITIDDVTDVLLEAFADPAWREIEAQWQAGLIGSATCMARQVAMMRCGRNALDEVLDGIRIDPGFPAFVAFCRYANASLTIVSDGLEYAIERILVRAGIVDLPIIANRLLFLSERRHAMLSPHASPSCSSAAGTCKCAEVDRADRLGPTILIGDGRSDFCAAGRVDFVLAKDALLDFCRARRIPHAAFSNFQEIPDLLRAHAAVTAPAGAEASEKPALRVSAKPNQRLITVFGEAP